MLEKVIVKAILDWLRECGCVVFKYHGHIYAVTGHSDIYGVTPDGKALYIEVKQPGIKATDVQLAFLERVAANNAIAFVAHSLDDVKTVMADYL